MFPGLRVHLSTTEYESPVFASPRYASPANQKGGRPLCFLISAAAAARSRSVGKFNALYSTNKLKSQQKYGR
jgi:hypothetical protein